MSARVLVVDDEREMGDFFSYLLETKGHEVTVAVSGAEARQYLARGSFHLAIIDLKLPDTDGITLLREIKALYPKCEVIVMTGYSTVRSAVEAIQLGAFDYLEKPFGELGELEEVIERALARATAKGVQGPDKRDHVLRSLGLVAGKSEKFRKLLLIAEKLAQKQITILLQGETGTGKELLARFIHAMSPRAEHPFFAVNCGALPETLLESELFGYQKGAFTGAAGPRKGIFELAHRGTLFLDEIGDASLAIQVKLLRVLETGEVMRLGAEKPVRVNVRVIAATNADLEELVRQKRFREDLFYRLNVVTLTLPPLRERKEDIPILAEHFLARHYPPGRAPRFSPEALEALAEHDWPGNIRELANTVAQVAALCDGPVVLPEHLPPKFSARRRREPETPCGEEDDFPRTLEEWDVYLRRALEVFAERVDLDAGFDLPRFLEAFREAELKAVQLLIGRALSKARGKYPKAAALLRTTPRALRYLQREKGRRSEAAAK